MAAFVYVKVIRLVNYYIDCTSTVLNVSMEPPLFCYGTLRSSLIMQKVTGHKFDGVDAILEGYAIFRVRGTEYPGIIQRKGSSVEGILYRGLDDNILHILDTFEGDQYYRDIVNTASQNDTNVKAYAYIIKESCQDILTNDSWNYDHFLHHEIDRFLHRFVEKRRTRYSF